MRKLIVFASAFALTGSMALAMDDDAMDEMMEAPAPSVSVGGSAAIGIINEDDDSDTTEDFKLIREYKVTFDSSGTTDGGLLFGAGISIEDTHDDDPGNAVNGAKVYVGSSDGSWKLQFGGNDPGIDLAGGFGVADDHFGGEDNEDIALSGSFGDTSYRITMADPGINIPAYGFNAAGDTEANNYKAVQDAMKANDDWSIGVSHSINTISVGVGMDSEDGLAIGVGTGLSGVSTFVYWSKSEYKNIDLDPTTTGAVAEGAFTEAAASIERGSQENTGLGVKASMSAGEGATLSAGIDKKDAESIDDPADAETTASNITSKDTTTLEAKISMSF
ncbi:MAG: porin [Rhodobacteraceae bacterium]|nr:porin [Paracoccaceae bacterium]